MFLFLVPPEPSDRTSEGLGADDKLFHQSLATGYPTLPSVMHSFMNSTKNVIALSLVRQSDRKAKSFIDGCFSGY